MGNASKNRGFDSSEQEIDTRKVIKAGRSRHTMAALQAMAMMTGRLPKITIKKPPKTYSGQGSKEKQRRLRQQQRMME